MNFSRRHTGTEVRCESRLFSQGKTPEFTKMGEIHKLFVLALSQAVLHGVPPAGWQLLKVRKGAFDALNKGLEHVEK